MMLIILLKKANPHCQHIVWYSIFDGYSEFLQSLAASIYIYGVVLVGINFNAQNTFPVPKNSRHDRVT